MSLLKMVNKWLTIKLTTINSINIRNSDFKIAKYRDIAIEKSILFDFFSEIGRWPNLHIIIVTLDYCHLLNIQIISAKLQSNSTHFTLINNNNNTNNSWLYFIQSPRFHYN